MASYWHLFVACMIKFLFYRANADGGMPVKWLNELEWIDGLIWGNIWQTDCIAQVDPDSGAVVGWLRTTGLRDRVLAAAQADAETARASNPGAAQGQPTPNVLNGIAYDRGTGRLWVTGGTCTCSLPPWARQSAAFLFSSLSRSTVDPLCRQALAAHLSD